MKEGRAISVAVVGVSESDLGITNKSSLMLLTQAARRAADDAGIALGSVDGLAVNGISQYSTAQVAEYLGLMPTWTDSTFAGGASPELFVGRAADAITSGKAETVLVAYGSNQRTARSRSLGPEADLSTPQGIWESIYHPLYPVSLYAMAATRYLHEFGVTMEQLAEIAVAAREWALLNPSAFRYGSSPLTIDDVLTSPAISTPLRSLDCCLVTDGGGAAVLTSLERARDLRADPVLVLGHGECTTSATMSGLPDLLHTGASESGARALQSAGVSIADIDVVQLYDSFTITVALTLEALGLCGPGEAAQYVNEVGIRPGGRLALNTSGGGLSYCHPGMFGIFLIIEAVRQLRREAGARQVGAPQLALAHGTGGIMSTHATVVLGVDR